MRVRYMIFPDGKVTQEVRERTETENCNKVYQVANLGEVLSDEQTGPDCDAVHETQIT